MDRCGMPLYSLTMHNSQEGGMKVRTTGVIRGTDFPLTFPWCPSPPPMNWSMYRIYYVRTYVYTVSHKPSSPLVYSYVRNFWSFCGMNSQASWLKFLDHRLRSLKWNDFLKPKYIWGPSKIILKHYKEAGAPRLWNSFLIGIHYFVGLLTQLPQIFVSGESLKQADVLFCMELLDVFQLKYFNAFSIQSYFFELLFMECPEDN